MRYRVEHRAMPIVGYVEPWTGPPGTRSLSASSDRPIDAVRIRRLDRDDMPAIDWPVRTARAAEHQVFARGAWASIERYEHLGAIANLSFEILLTRNVGRKVLLDGGTFQLVIKGGALELEVGGHKTQLVELPSREWLRLELNWHEGRLTASSLNAFKPHLSSAAFDAPRPMIIALFSDVKESVATLNARLGRIQLSGADGVADWVFPTLFTEAPMIAAGAALRLRGGPTFCVCSARWDGSVLDPRLAPDHYDALHFHETDMEGLDWPVNYTVEIPDGAESGVYAFELISADISERIPFFVATSHPAAALLFVVPTSTYLAYADEYLPPHLYEWIGTDGGHVFARDNELRSLYDFHADGSGVSLVSTRKPKATLRDDYKYPLCGDPHNLPVDLHFLKFCARHGIAVDVATDADLHREGAALLGRYRGVITGSHPEYLSVRMEQAYRGYVAGGGRLAYLGGNGFAAVVAYRDEWMELRRGPTQAGRTWDGPLAEMSLALTNEPGGYLRDRGKGEHRLVGVGISLMGFSSALPFQRREASFAKGFEWLFAGVADCFGDSGIVLGGAAGYEVDSVNYPLGSPLDIVILATATGFPDDYVDDPGRWFEAGNEDRRSQRRADMTFWKHPSGGIIFSASSVSFLGALPGQGENNDVGTLTINLLRGLEQRDVL
ncbi:N,N-dimethylformamidase [Kaistia soli DSM 19436]|uniref:N,N-dimethylformamidase n=1 Tax=Kaistia soli DSM 19436 TaxID=1122133 RepID=A0A1M5DJ71_9HYPH|nr:N,N-dimethylformamidase beta subunit family domain-containing protein [Kaistia soli]SHF66941.1 N,N-dimethylformamidase [Kaistia soli DSM 19436]